MHIHWFPYGAATSINNIVVRYMPHTLLRPNFTIRLFPPYVLSKVERVRLKEKCNILYNIVMAHDS